MILTPNSRIQDTATSGPNVMPDPHSKTCWPACAGSQAVDIMQIGPVRLSDIPLAAVDFHVSSIVEEMATSPSHAAQLKKAMWQCSSGVTSKTAFDPHSAQACLRSMKGGQQAIGKHGQPCASAGDAGQAHEGGIAPALQAHKAIDTGVQETWSNASRAVTAWAQSFLAKRFY